MSFHQDHPSLFMFSNFRSTILETPKSKCLSLCLYVSSKKSQVWVQKMSYQFVINHLFLLYQTATTLYTSCVKSSMQSSTKVKFHVLFWARKNKKYLKIDIYLNHSSVLPIQASVTITLICKENQQDDLYTMVTLLIPGTNFFKYWF